MIKVLVLLLVLVWMVQALDEEDAFASSNFYCPRDGPESDGADTTAIDHRYERNGDINEHAGTLLQVRLDSSGSTLIALTSTRISRYSSLLPKSYWRYDEEPNWRHEESTAIYSTEGQDMEMVVSDDRRWAVILYMTSFNHRYIAQVYELRNLRSSYDSFRFQRHQYLGFGIPERISNIAFDQSKSKTQELILLNKQGYIYVHQLERDSTGQEMWTENEKPRMGNPGIDGSRYANGFRGQVAACEGMIVSINPSGQIYAHRKQNLTKGWDEPGNVEFFQVAFPADSSNNIKHLVCQGDQIFVENMDKRFGLGVHVFDFPFTRASSVLNPFEDHSVKELATVMDFKGKVISILARVGVQAAQLAQYKVLGAGFQPVLERQFSLEFPEVKGHDRTRRNFERYFKEPSKLIFDANANSAVLGSITSYKVYKLCNPDVNVGLVVGSTLGSVFAVALCIGIVIFRRKKKRRQTTANNNNTPTRFSSFPNPPESSNNQNSIPFAICSERPSSATFPNVPFASPTEGRSSTNIPLARCTERPSTVDIRNVPVAVSIV